MPSGSAIATDTISPSSVSSAEAGRRLRISVTTGWPVVSDWPRSPFARSPTYRTNCCGSDLSRPSFTRVCSIASSVAAGPAKYAAGSPGSARVSRKVTITTPIRLGIAMSRRFAMTASMRSPLHERAVVEPAMEPVLITADVLLHRDVDVGLEDRDPRHIGKRKVDEALHLLLVRRLVAGRGCIHGAVDIRVALFRLVAHRVEDRILAVIAPDEEVFRIVEPA